MIRLPESHTCKLLWMKPLLFCLLLLAGNGATAQPVGLYEKVRALDSLFFKAYNECDLATQSAFYSDSIEFYHDQGGLIRSKAALLESTRQYICGKVSRELEPGSIEVSPIPGYGAVETGLHRFINHAENSRQEKASRFVIIWHQEGEKWTVSRVISLH